MKRMLVLAGFLSTWAWVASAHPPTAVAVTVNDKRVAIDVTHPVGDPAEHFISKIEVRLNGRSVVRQYLSSQTGNEQKVEYVIPNLRKGDKLQVEAACNKYGSLTREVTVN